MTDAHFFASTMPSADIPQTVQDTLGPLLDNQKARQLGGDSATSALGCWLCKAAFGALAILVALVATLVPLLTVESTVVKALVRVTPFADKTVIIILKVLLNPTSIVAVSIVASNVCGWIGACNSGPSVSLTAPDDNQRVSGVVSIKADATQGDADVREVQFVLDGTLLSARTATPYEIS